MKALGMISGIGSMLIGAKQQGWKVLGNIEWRKYYHTGTFEHNFKGAFMVESLDKVPEGKDLSGIDLVIGHTECGIYSNMRVTKVAPDSEEAMGDIPIFVEAVQKLKPKFFVMDNLAASLKVAGWDYYAEKFPEYDIHFEWVSNHGYGNIQKHRNRMFVIGSLKELEFVFIPDEYRHADTILDRIEEIDPNAENNDPLDEDSIYGGWARYMFDPEYIPKSVDENRITLREFKELIKDSAVGDNFKYFNKSGEQKKKIGFCKINVDGPGRTLSGGGACFDNHFRDDTLMPFTIRERAKIQGCPDDFVFLPTGVTQTGPTYGKLIKQTGKFMPVEFCTYVTGLIKAHLEGTLDPEEYTQERVIKPNPLIDEHKQAYCREVGLAAGLMACDFCGSRATCTKFDDLFK